MAGSATLPAPSLGAGEQYSAFTKVSFGGMVVNVTSISSAANLPASSPVAVVYNGGAVAAYVEVADCTSGSASLLSAVQGTSIPVPAGGSIVLNTSGCNAVAAVTSSGSTVLSVVQGFGHP